MAVVRPMPFCPAWCACSVCSPSSSGFMVLLRLLKRILRARLVPFEKFQAPTRIHALRNVIILQDADRAIYFQHGQSNVAELYTSMFAEGTVELVHGDVL